jgi:hypothetical protein
MNMQALNFNTGISKLGNTAQNTARNTGIALNTQMNNFSSRFSALSFSMQIITAIVALLVLIFIAYSLYSFGADFFTSYTDEPYLVKGTKLGKSSLIIPGSMVPPSVDQKYGAEFSYAMWIYITDYTYKQNEWKHILHKGSSSAMPLQSPGIWLYPKENKLAINMNTFYSVKESCDIGNIPVGKWFHLSIVVIGKFIDVYINGRLKKRCEFKGVPKQNYGDVYINQWQGFDGFLSNVRYFAYALPFFRIEQLVLDGPDSASCIDDKLAKPPYLAPGWWQNEGFGRQPMLDESGTQPTPTPLTNEIPENNDQN